MDTSTQQEKHQGNPNPSPSTRFGGERGNTQSPGGWKKENAISYQYNRFMSMSRQELTAFGKLPDKDKTMAMMIAYARVLVASSAKGLPDAKEIADRTEGKAPQNIDMKSSDGSMTPILVTFVNE